MARHTAARGCIIITITIIIITILIAIVIVIVIAIIITIGIRPKTECLAVGRNQSPFGRNQSRIQPWVAEAMATSAAATKVLSALFGGRAGWKVGPSRAGCAGPTPPFCPLPKFHIQAIDAKGKAARKKAHEFSNIMEKRSVGAPTPIPPEEATSPRERRSAMWPTPRARCNL